MRVIRAFRDGKGGPVRRRGEKIEVSKAQAKYLADNRYVEYLGDAPEEDGGSELEQMTVKDLKALADQRGVDLSGASKKADMIQALEDAAAASGSDGESTDGADDGDGQEE